MKQEGWHTLSSLRHKRADRALSESQRAQQEMRAAESRLGAAAAAFDERQAHRQSQLQSIYDGMSARTFSVAEAMRMSDWTNAIRHGAAQDREQLLQVAAGRHAADKAAQDAVGLYREKLRAAERSESVEREVSSRRDRKDAILTEVEAEDLAATTRAFGGRGADHA